MVTGGEFGEMPYWYSLFEASEGMPGGIYPWQLDPHWKRSRVYWMQHSLAYKGTREWFEDYKEAKILKAMSKSGMPALPRKKR